jgi:DNA-binding HxlR family transcriptional regulator
MGSWQSTPDEEKAAWPPSRLAHLEHQGILTKKLSERDKRKEEYVLTEKGLDLIPILVEMSTPA